MKLITNEIRKKAPAIGSTSELKACDVKVIAKFFTPYGQWAWYLTEYDDKTGEAFGYVKGFENELGYFSIPEMEETMVFGRMKAVERDRFFGDHTLEDVIEGRVY